MDIQNIFILLPCFLLFILLLDMILSAIIFFRKKHLTKSWYELTINCYHQIEECKNLQHKADLIDDYSERTTKLEYYKHCCEELSNSFYLCFNELLKQKISPKKKKEIQELYNSISLQK